MTDLLPRPPALPVIVIGGYLGAGKTTLLNHLLRHADGRRLAVLVNDFGELSIDADLILGQDGDVLRLAGGCVCCAIGSDLIESLMQLGESRSPPDLVLIETSGVALPGAVGRGAKLAPGVRLEGVVVMVDAATVQTLSSDRYVGDTVLQQLRDADLLVLNKLDLVDPADLPALHRWLHEHAPTAVRMDTVDGQVPAQTILGLRLAGDGTMDRVDVDAGLETDLGMDAEIVSGKTASEDRPDRSRWSRSPLKPPTASAPAASRFGSLSLSLPEPIDVTELMAALADPQLGIVRAKGVLTDMSRGPLVVQGVGGRWRADAATPAQARSASAGQLVVIGLVHAFDPRTLTARIEAHTAQGAAQGATRQAGETPGFG